MENQTRIEGKIRLISLNQTQFEALKPNERLLAFRKVNEARIKKEIRKLTFSEFISAICGEIEQEKEIRPTEPMLFKKDTIIEIGDAEEQRKHIHSGKGGVNKTHRIKQTEKESHLAWLSAEANKLRSPKKPKKTNKALKTTKKTNKDDLSCFRLNLGLFCPAETKQVQLDLISCYGCTKLTEMLKEVK